MSRSYNKRFLTIKCLSPIGGGVSHNMTFMQGDLPAILPATSDLPASRKFLCQVLPQVDNLDIWQTSSRSYLAIYIISIADYLNQDLIRNPYPRSCMCYKQASTFMFSQVVFQYPFPSTYSQLEIKSWFD